MRATSRCHRSPVVFNLDERLIGSALLRRRIRREARHHVRDRTDFAACAAQGRLLVHWRRNQLLRLLNVGAELVLAVGGKLDAVLLRVLDLKKIVHLDSALVLAKRLGPPDCALEHDELASQS